MQTFQLLYSLTSLRFVQHWLQCHKGGLDDPPYEARVCEACGQHINSEHHEDVRYRTC